MKAGMRELRELRRWWLDVWNHKASLFLANILINLSHNFISFIKLQQIVGKEF
jgi:hypothetical protein